MSKHVLNTRLRKLGEQGGSAASKSWNERLRPVGRTTLAPNFSRLWVQAVTPSLGQKSYLGDEEPLPPLDVVTEADWRGDVERLYRSRADDLIRHFAGRTRDAESARDIVHEAFAKLAGMGFAKRLMLVRTDSYLFKICMNLFHDRGRAESARHKIALYSEPQSFENPLATLEDRDTLRRLEQAMSRLKPKTRAIFLARRVEGLGYAEIAEQTGLSVKGVEKQMAKAIATIDRLLDRDAS